MNTARGSLACREARHDIVHVHHSLAGHLGHAVQRCVHLVMNDGPELQADAAPWCPFIRKEELAGPSSHAVGSPLSLKSAADA